METGLIRRPHARSVSPSVLALPPLSSNLPLLDSVLRTALPQLVVASGIMSATQIYCIYVCVCVCVYVCFCVTGIHKGDNVLTTGLNLPGRWREVAAALRSLVLK